MYYLDYSSDEQPTSYTIRVKKGNVNATDVRTCATSLIGNSEGSCFTEAVLQMDENDSISILQLEIDRYIITTKMHTFIHIYKY